MSQQADFFVELTQKPLHEPERSDKQTQTVSAASSVLKPFQAQKACSESQHLGEELSPCVGDLQELTQQLVRQAKLSEELTQKLAEQCQHAESRTKTS